MKLSSQDLASLLREDRTTASSQNSGMISFLPSEVVKKRTIIISHISLCSAQLHPVKAINFNN